jgi:hypothetical protein
MVATLVLLLIIDLNGFHSCFDFSLRFFVQVGLPLAFENTPGRSPFRAFFYRMPWNPRKLQQAKQLPNTHVLSNWYALFKGRHMRQVWPSAQMITS